MDSEQGAVLGGEFVLLTALGNVVLPKCDGAPNKGKTLLSTLQ